MRRIGLLLSAGLLALVSACSDPTGLFSKSDPHDAYCAALLGARPQIADMLASNDPAALFNGLPLLQSLQSQAPPEMVASWQTLTSAIEGLRSALAAANVKPSDYVHGQPPAGLTPAQRASIQDAASTLSSTATTTASTSIDQEARDVCKINLGM